jgi:hypothetical protein
MKKMLLITLFALLATGAMAEDLIESFDDPLGQWRSGWLATNSNMQNYYVANGDPDEDNRGNNPCGLWIHDGDLSSAECFISFDAGFGASVSYFEIGIEAFGDFQLSIYDISGNLVDSVAIPNTGGSGEYGCTCLTYGFVMPNGLGSFSLTGGNVEGNTGIDDVKVTTGTTATGESTWGAIKALYR